MFGYPITGDRISFEQEREKRAEWAAKACSAISPFLPFLVKAYSITLYLVTELTDNLKMIRQADLKIVAVSPDGTKVDEDLSVLGDE